MKVSSDSQKAASRTSFRLLVQVNAREADHALISWALVLGAVWPGVEFLYANPMTVLGHLDQEDLPIS